MRDESKMTKCVQMVVFQFFLSKLIIGQCISTNVKLGLVMLVLFADSSTCIVMEKYVSLSFLSQSDTDGVVMELANLGNPHISLNENMKAKQMLCCMAEKCTERGMSLKLTWQQVLESKEKKTPRHLGEKKIKSDGIRHKDSKPHIHSSILDETMNYLFKMVPDFVLFGRHHDSSLLSNLLNLYRYYHRMEAVLPIAEILYMYLGHVPVHVIAYVIAYIATFSTICYIQIYVIKKAFHSSDYVTLFDKNRHVAHQMHATNVETCLTHESYEKAKDKLVSSSVIPKKYPEGEMLPPIFKKHRANHSLSVHNTKDTRIQNISPRCLCLVNDMKLWEQNSIHSNYLRVWGPKSLKYSVDTIQVDKPAYIEKMVRTKCDNKYISMKFTKADDSTNNVCKSDNCTNDDIYIRHKSMLGSSKMLKHSAKQTDLCTKDTCACCKTHLVIDLQPENIVTDLNSLKLSLCFVPESQLRLSNLQNLTEFTIESTALFHNFVILNSHMLNSLPNRSLSRLLLNCLHSKKIILVHPVKAFKYILFKRSFFLDNSLLGRYGFVKDVYKRSKHKHSRMRINTMYPRTFMESWHVLPEGESTNKCVHNVETSPENLQSLDKSPTEEKELNAILFLKKKLSRTMTNAEVIHEDNIDIEGDFDKSTFPKMLEVRGEQVERRNLIRELSERFFSERNNSVGQGDVKSNTTCTKEEDIVADERDDIKGEKLKNQQFTQWRNESFQHLPKNLYAFPISQYFERIATFAKWPVESPISAIRLSEAGFHYTGVRQLVECLSCRLQVSEWKAGDVPLEVHQKMSPFCVFLQTKEHKIEDQNLDGNTDSKFTENLSVPEKCKYDVFANRRTTDDTSLQCDLSDHCQSSISLSEVTNTGRPVDITEDGQHACVSGLPETERHTDVTGLSEDVGATGFQNDLPNQFRSALSLSEDSRQVYTPVGILRGMEESVGDIELDSGSIKHPEYATIQARLASFRFWCIHDKQNPVTLVDAGFYFTGNEDIVRCFCCDIGLSEWDAKDDPWVEHARHSPTCSYVIKERGQIFIDGIQESWRQVYSPRHPHLADFHVRLQTFTSWPSYLEQRPNVLCEAGFFYTGEDDVVRCHYCDGGLRQWEPGDEPWMEHAKWFPFCKYIVKIRGLAFIEDVARRYNEVNNVLEDELPREDYTSLSNIGNDNSTIESLLDPHQPSNPVRYVVSQGFSLENVMMAVEQFTQFNGRRNFTASDLINIIRERERIGDVLPETNRGPFVRGRTVDNKPSKALAGVISQQGGEDMEKLDEKQLEDANKQLKNLLMCKLCHARESEMVCTPCGHRVMCEICSSNVKRCPQCERTIENCIKTYLA